MDSAFGILAVAGGFMVFFLILVVALYVISALAFSKALKTVGYKYPWFAWIPFLNLYALTDAALDTDDDAKRILFNKVNITKQIAKFWIVAYIIIGRIPTVGSYIAMALMVLVMGPVYALLYAKIEEKTYEDTQVLGYVSAFIPIVPVFKWLGLKTKKTAELDVK